MTAREPTEAAYASSCVECLDPQKTPCRYGKCAKWQHAHAVREPSEMHVATQTSVATVWMYETEKSCAGPFKERVVTFTLDRWERVRPGTIETQMVPVQPSTASPESTREEIEWAAHEKWWQETGRDNGEFSLTTKNQSHASWQARAAQSTPVQPSTEGASRDRT